MNIDRLTVKFFVEEDADFVLTDVIPVFHRWIQTDAVPGLLIDVADYKHVPHGPGILLVGQDVDYALDLTDGRLGFLTRRKQIRQMALVDTLPEALAWAVQAVQRLEQDTGWQLRADELEITLADRLHAPNTAETFTAVQDVVTAVLRGVYGDEPIDLVYGAVDARRPFTLSAHIPSAPSLAQLVAQLALPG